MRRYETIFILDPDLSEEGRVPVFDRLKDLLPKHNGTLLETDEWGMRKLAYAIKKKPRGYYVRLDYCGDGSTVNEMERYFRIDDRILKYMTVLLDAEADVEGLLAEQTADQNGQETPAEDKAAEVKPAEASAEASPETSDAASEPTETEAVKAKEAETESAKEA